MKKFGIFLILLAGCNCKTDLIKYNVLIESKVETPFGNYYSLGSGVIISDDGNIITAGHVLQGATEIRVTLYDGRVFDVTEYYVDEKVDIGFLDLPGEYDFIKPQAATKDLKIIGIGNSQGIFLNVVRKGTVLDAKFSRLFLGKDIDCLLLKMHVQPGDSGGGVFYKEKLVGIMIIHINDTTSIAVSWSACEEALDRWKNSNER